MMFLGILPGSLYAYLLPEESSGEDRREVKLMGISSSIAVVTFASLASPWLIKTFFPSFAEAVSVVQVMCLVVIPMTVSSLSNARLFGRERSKYAFTGGVVYLVSLTSGLIMLGRMMGITGLAFSMILAQALQATYLWSKAGLAGSG